MSDLNRNNNVLRTLQLFNEINNIANEYGHSSNYGTNLPPNASTNQQPDLLSIMHQYNLNMETYNNNIRDYQYNISLYLRTLIANAEQPSLQRPRTRARPRYTWANPTGGRNQLFQNLYQFFDNVHVFPTQTQIVNATERTVYSENNDNRITQCPISLDDFQEGEPVIRIRHCGHTFQENAIMNWFQSNTRCPVCRYDIRDYHPTTETTQEPNAETTNNENNVTDDFHDVENPLQPISEEEDEEIPPLLPTTTSMPRQRDSQPYSSSFSIPTPLRQQSASGTSSRPNSVNTIISSLTNNLGGIIQEYLNENDVQFDISNNVATFDLPVYFYEFQRRA